MVLDGQTTLLVVLVDLVEVVLVLQTVPVGLLLNLHNQHKVVY
jgi:hypothetical protein